MNVLGIETSCDDTAAAICCDGQILSTLVSSQLIHSDYGGVVPELASREHERLLNTLVQDALREAHLTLQNLEGIAVTRGPGLAGTLLTGVCFAKGLAQGLNIPMIGINHLEAHIFANFLADPALEFPFLCLLVSGGHTQIWEVHGLGDYKMLGETRDDAAGEAFDKGSRILGMGYPGGPAIEKLARGGNESAVDFPKAFINKDTIEFSFSGLKTALLYYMQAYEKSPDGVSREDIAASYQSAIIEVLIGKLAQAVDKSGVQTCVIAGGVAANQRLRQEVKNKLSNYRVIYPDLPLCTDNAAMVAFLGEQYLSRGKFSNANFSIAPNLKLD